MSPSDDIAIGFTGPWVNVFYEQTTLQGAEIRGVRQFPVANPDNDMQYIPYPEVLATFTRGVEIEMRSIARPLGVVSPDTNGALLIRADDMQSSELLLIRAPTPWPDALPGVEAAAFRPNGELVTFRAGDLPQSIYGLVGAGATDLDVALVDTAYNAQNQTYEIRYHQTAFGTRDFLPPVVLASGRDLDPYMVNFTMTAAGIPHVVFTDPDTRKLIARDFDPKLNHWTTNVLYDLDAGADPWIQLDSRGETVAATWAGANPNNPDANDLYVAQKISEWEVSLVCAACVGNADQLDITFGPDGFPVIAYVSPTNQLMVAYDPPSPEPALPGDINLDRRVDRTDVALMALQYGTAGFTIGSTTDIDGDHRVVLADLAILQAHLGDYLAVPTPAATPALATIPEPSTIWILLAATLAAAIGRAGDVHQPEA
jgi:hypothetical protein